MSTGPTKRTADEAGMDTDIDITSQTNETGITSNATNNKSHASTTIGTSITNNEDNELTRQRAELKAELDRIESERQALSAGTHGIYLERCAVFESVRAEAIAKATAQRQYQLESIERMFEYQKYAADKICDNSKNELSTSLLKELTEKAEILNAKLLGQNEPTRNEPRVQRSLRSKRKADEVGTTGTGLNTGLSSGLPGTSSTTGLTTIYEHPPPVLSIPLPSTEAVADMKAIYRDWKAVAQKWRQVNATALLPTRVELNKLYYINDEFNRGDAVIVFSELTKEEFYGHVHQLSTIEVIVKLGSGARIRIPLQHLRHGRVSLYKYAIGQPNSRIPTIDNNDPSLSASVGGSDGGNTNTNKRQTTTTNNRTNNRQTNDNTRRNTNLPPQNMIPGSNLYIPPPGPFPNAQIVFPPAPNMNKNVNNPLPMGNPPIQNIPTTTLSSPTQ